MKLLDWYILKKFLSAFFFTVLLLVLIICVIDYTERNDDFLKHNIKFGFVMKEYYLNFIPYISNMLSPITVFIATVFVTANLAARTEIIAILSSGVSFKRFLVPYIIGATFIGLLVFYLGGWVIPKANKDRVNFENAYLKGEYYFDQRNIHIKTSKDTYVFMESFNNQILTGYQFTLENITGTNLNAKITANKISWVPEKRAWRLSNYSYRTFNGMHETLRKGYQMDTVINISPKDFENNYLLHETFTLPELEKYISDLKEKGAENIQIYRTEKYERYTYPFAIIILTIIGVIVSSRKSREGVGFQIAFGFLLAFVYIIFVIMSRSIASVGSIGPLMAAWIPNIIFSGIGVIMYKTVPK